MILITFWLFFSFIGCLLIPENDLTFFFVHIFGCSNQSVASTAQEEDYPDQPQSPPHAPENLSPPVGSVSSGAVPKHDQSKQEMLLPTGGPHFPVVQPLPNYSFGFMPPMLGSSLVQFEGPDAQAQDNSHSPNIVVSLQSYYFAMFFVNHAILFWFTLPWWLMNVISPQTFSYLGLIVVHLIICITFFALMLCNLIRKFSLTFCLWQMHLLFCLLRLQLYTPLWW